ncbi:hypothetical protein [Staphylococcus pseudintermedius]|uniref:hypothetical protein n=1 Tax=Staphylococcus pseudintermedius TaxID=283734 RepID=UPI003980F8D3
MTDDEPIDGETWATWYAEQLNVSSHIKFFKAQSFEHGAENRKYKAQGGTLLYST